ncbi:MAG: adventurous gliding motility protein CglE [Deltaproteobacteria bacterium]|nr:adventurous gliding motility protein CglE [Deltaproteobacteria bacterium]
MKTLLSLLLILSPLAVSTVAHAGDYDDLDAPDSSRRGSKAPKAKKGNEARASRQALENEIVREIERGLYAKSTVGTTIYLGNLGNTMDPGTTTVFTLGKDFHDTATDSMAWEVSLYQGLHNGLDYSQQGQISTQGYPPALLHQGDSRSFMAMAAYEYSTYPSRRVGLGVRAGGGVMIVPLLMEASHYQTDVVVGAWRGTSSAIHDGIHPVGFAGPTFEYYTKLSHFSVGVDADVMYAVGMDLGLTAAGYLKYTF